MRINTKLRWGAAECLVDNEVPFADFVSCLHIDLDSATMTIFPVHSSSDPGIDDDGVRVEIGRSSERYSRESELYWTGRGGYSHSATDSLSLTGSTNTLSLVVLAGLCRSSLSQKLRVVVADFGQVVSVKLWEPSLLDLSTAQVRVLLWIMCGCSVSP